MMPARAVRRDYCRANSLRRFAAGANIGFLKVAAVATWNPF
jgi:hypothetical protein